MVIPPGSDAALRMKETQRSLAISLDCDGRYCHLNPCEGAKLAVAEAARNVACGGARPLAITNCLNFANPERPQVAWVSARRLTEWSKPAARSGLRSLAATSVFITRPKERGSIRLPSAALYPNKNLQEREINVFYFLARYGYELIDRVYDEVEVGLRGHKLINL